jgi:hypothetical protein
MTIVNLLRKCSHSLRTGENTIETAIECENLVNKLSYKGMRVNTSASLETISLPSSKVSRPLKITPVRDWPQIVIDGIIIVCIALVLFMIGSLL